MSRETLCFSMYSLMSMRIISFSSSKRNSASARASSVFPTPVGPRKINEPMGRLVSESPARLRRTAFETRASASFCPTTRCRGHFAVADFRHLRQFAGALVLQFFRFQLIDLLFQLADLADGFFLRLPARLSAARIFLEHRQFFFNLSSALFRMRVLLLQQRLALNFQLHDPSLDFIDFHGQGINLHAQAGCGLVDEVNGLVRQEAVRNVTVRKRSRRDDGSVLDPHAVMHLVAVL